MGKKTFEQSLSQLEKIVQELEDGDLPLEKAIKKFEEGIRISKLCGQKLDETEKRINLLMQNGNSQHSETAFESDQEE